MGSSLAFSTVHSVRDVPALEWAPLATPRSLYLSRPWLSVAERDTAFTARYILARDDSGRLVGALPVYLWHGVGGAVATYYDPFRLFFAHLEPEDRRSEWFPALLVGARSGYANEPLVDGELSPADRRTVLAGLLEQALDLAKALGARSVAMLYLDRASLEAWIEHTGEAKVLLTSADARLSVEWDSFDGYLASLNSDHRKKVRREVRTFRELAPPADRVRFSACWEEAARLVARLERRYGHGGSEDALRAFFEAQAAELDDRSHVFMCSEDSAMVGFALFYAYGDVLYARVCGFDEDRKVNDFMYFNLGYYEPIRHAAATGCRSLLLGTGSWKAKVLRGATLEPLWSVLFRPDAIAERDWPGILTRWNEYRSRRWHDFAASVHTDLDRSAWRQPG